MFIRSERLFLRPGWPEDWQDIQRQIGSEAIVRNLARAPWPYRAEDAQAFAALPQDPRTPHFVITVPGASGADLIGGIGFQDCGEGVELGYWIARARQVARFTIRAFRAWIPRPISLAFRWMTNGELRISWCWRRERETISYKGRGR